MSQHVSHNDRPALEDSEFDSEGAIEGYQGRGVWVPHGQSAAWIMEGARVLENKWEVAPYISRMMVSAVLETVLPLIRRDETFLSSRRDEGLRALLKMPPKPHSEIVGKRVKNRSTESRQRKKQGGPAGKA